MVIAINAIKNLRKVTKSGEIRLAIIDPKTKEPETRSENINIAM